MAGRARRELVDAYRAAMRRRALAAGTITTRTAELRRWLAWVGADWSTATRADVERWIDRRPLGARARYCAISHLHAFYVWAIRSELVEHDPTVTVERPRLGQRLPRPIRPDDVAGAIDAASAELAAVLALMAWAGLRCCEIAALDWSDVDLTARVVLVHGKGDRDRLVGLPLVAVRALAALDATAGPVYPAAARAAHPAALVSRHVREHLHRCGVTASAHRLRHTYATALYRATGGDLLAVQRALGHASVATTAIYAAADPDRALAAARALDA
jgi:site-specific recombinase XerD